MIDFKTVTEWVGKIVEVAGVLVILIGTLVATFRFFARLKGGGDVYRPFRHDLGRAILLGLEFLVAGDIINTVAVSPTLESVAVLAIIVLIRTFLSIALEVELEGRFPWQRGGQGS